MITLLLFNWNQTLWACFIIVYLPSVLYSQPSAREYKMLLEPIVFDCRKTGNQRQASSSSKFHLFMLNEFLWSAVVWGERYSARKQYVSLVYISDKKWSLKMGEFFFLKVWAFLWSLLCCSGEACVCVCLWITRPSIFKYINKGKTLQGP